MASGEPPNPAPPPAESEPIRVKKLVSEWWEVVVAVAAVITGVTTGVLGESAAQKVALPAAFVLVGVSTLVVWWRKRRQRRREAERKKAEDERTDRGGPAAFVGPNPYRCGDTLPGPKRRDEVRAVAAAIADPAFRFGVASGELGSGKTSFLDAGVRVALQEQGFNVVLVGSPRELWPREPAEATQWSAQAFATRIGNRLPKDRTTVVLVIDQFEEFFADVKAADIRAGVGQRFEKLIAEGVRVVLGLRWDYGLDVLTLSDKLPPLVPQKTLFKLEYLTPDEAAGVIRECAGRDERVKLDDPFPQTVAADLTKADDGLVRPIELQIVCNALRGTLALADYRVAGGARGILSRFIQVTVDACPHPRAGRKLLRAACRFSDKVGAGPQTAGELRDGIELPDVTPQVVTQILRQFEAARLLVRERDGGGEAADSEPRYRLTHHYLLGPIADVTRQEVTAAEEAEQYLTLYLGETGSVVPFRRLLFIRRQASPAARARPDVRRLIRRSWRAITVSLAAWAGGAIVGVLAIPVMLGWVTLESVWVREVVATYQPDMGHGRNAFQLVGGNPLEVFTEVEGRLRKWALRDRGAPGRLRTPVADDADVISGTDFQFSPGGRYVFYRPNPEERNVVVRDTTKGTTAPTPFTFPGRPLLAFTEDGDVVAATDSSVDVHTRAEYRVWSLTGQTELGGVSNIRHFRSHGTKVSSNPPRLVAYCLDEQNRKSVGLFDYSTGKRLAYLSRGNRVSSFILDPRRNFVYTIEGVPETGEPEDEKHLIKRWVVRRWGLQDGAERPTSYDLPGGVRVDPKFASREPSIIVTGAYGTHVLAVLNPDNFESLLPTEAKTAKSVRLVRKDPPVAMWETDGGVEVWPLNKNATARSKLAGFVWDYDSQVVVRRDAKRLAALYRGDKLVLWNLETNTELKTLRAAADGSRAAENDRIFTSIADGCLCETTGPARVRLYDWDDGRVLADLTEVGGEEFGRLIHYDGVSRQVYVWSDRGDVALYTERRQVFGRFRLWRTGHD